MSAPLKIAVVTGEESGDLLAADLVAALARKSGRPIELMGVGGEHLAALGLTTLFDPSSIALMGISAVVKDLPALVRKIRQTADAIVTSEPDLLLIVDSPDFTHRVARRVRAKLPHLPVVNYVCPSVWAWRPQRAKSMRGYVDHVLCLLPFEVDALKRLDGPAGTFVGHRLTADGSLNRAHEAQSACKLDAAQPTLLILPGSRRGEVRGLLPFFGETVEFLEGEGVSPRLVLPTVAHVEPLVREITASWTRKPEIVIGAEARHQAFAEADAAIAASGTVTLELALAGVPLISCYRTDLLARFLRHLITSWSASLPNLIADRPVVPELYDFMLRPGYAGRHLLALLEDGPMRAAQRKGFQSIRERMETERPAGDIAADAVLSLLG